MPNTCLRHEYDQFVLRHGPLGRQGRYERPIVVNPRELRPHFADAFQEQGSVDAFAGCADDHAPERIDKLGRDHVAGYARAVALCGNKHLAQVAAENRLGTDLARRNAFRLERQPDHLVCHARLLGQCACELGRYVRAQLSRGYRVHARLVNIEGRDRFVQRLDRKVIALECAVDPFGGVPPVLVAVDYVHDLAAKVDFDVYIGRNVGGLFHTRDQLGVQCGQFCGRCTGIVGNVRCVRGHWGGFLRHGGRAFADTLENNRHGVCAMGRGGMLWGATQYHAGV